jgi:glycolate oxidase FAD binding subunit
LSMGNPPERVDLVLSTGLLGGIIDYEPTDLVLSVGAGARFGDVQAVLGEHGQRLPLDPPGGADATIGGLIATGRWGPLRASAGTLRDLLIGIAVAHPSGTVSRAGGMVVKNVSGYDMPRLYLGSLGTLGIIVSANFKVLPRPRAESTIIAGFASSQDAFAAADRLRQSMEPVAALEVALLDRRWIMATRIEGRDATVDAVASRIAPVLPSDDMVRLDSGPSAEWWHTYVAQQAAVPNDNAVLIRCGVRPKVASGFVSGMVAALSDVGISAQYLAVSPGLGSVVARLDLGGNESPERLAEAQAVLLGLADTVTILAAPPDWKRGIDVWGRLPEGFDVMRSLRQQFDPQRTINPGRFAGFL